MCYVLRFSFETRLQMPRYEYRKLTPLPEAEGVYDAWIERLDREFINRDPEHRSVVVRNTLHEIYLGHPYSAPEPRAPLAQQSLVHSFDPRNATLEPEYYGDVDATKYAERKPLIWFWMMFDRSPIGINHGLGYRIRAMLAGGGTTFVLVGDDHLVGPDSLQSQLARVGLAAKRI